MFYNWYKHGMRADMYGNWAPRTEYEALKRKLEAAQAEIDSLLSSRAARSHDTPAAQKTASIPRSGQRIAILRKLRAQGARSPDQFEVGPTFGKCPWKRLSELHQLGLVERCADGVRYEITDAGRDLCAELGVIL